MQWFSKVRRSFFPSSSSSSQSTLSPFASRILEKAKSEALKDDDDREKISSPAQLFLSSEEAKKRVGHIESIALEKAKNTASTFTAAAKVMPDTNPDPSKS